MNIFNLIKINSKNIWIILLLSLSLTISLYINISFSNVEKENKRQGQILAQKKEENKWGIYIWDSLKKYKEYIDKIKSINQPDLASFWDELNKLFLNWISKESLELSLTDWFKMTWYAPNMRTIDLQVNLLNTFNKLYGWFEWPVTLDNVSSKNGVFLFSISWKINWDAIKNQIYTNDIDWDAIKDYEIADFKNNVWINQKKVILNDHCPLTPKFNLVIRELIKNTDISSIFPYYQKLKDDWYFSLQDDWCLNAWDIKID